MKKILVLLVVSIFFITSCHAIPKDALTLSQESLTERQLQTRKYETKDEKKILESCSSLLQDLGFNLDESETKLGLITASKTRDATDAGQIVGVVLLAAFSGVVVPWDKEQIMRACVVTRSPGDQSDYIFVRVTFQRVVFNTQRQVTKSESLTDASLYQEFFDKLSKSIFLKEHEI